MTRAKKINDKTAKPEKTVQCNKVNLHLTDL